MDVHTLISTAGGVGKLATLLGVSHSTVCDWKRVGHIPGRRLPQVVAALGINPADLLGLVHGFDVIEAPASAVSGPPKREKVAA